MGYHLPALLPLLKNIGTIRSQYPHTLPDRIKLIDLLENLAKFSNTEIIVGAYIYCLSVIKNKYYFFDPEHKKGRFFNSGSTLYTILSSHLEMSASNPLTEIDKLIYLTKFYYFFQENKLLINPLVCEDEIISVIQSLFKKIASIANHWLHAIPDEKKIDHKMKNILTLYLDRHAENEERIFLAKFAQFLADKFPANEKREISPILSRTMKIKIGFLLYILISIENSYIIRSPNNSKLYHLCVEALNIKHSIDIDNETKLTCLIAFKNCIHDDNNTIKLLEEYFLKNMDITLDNMQEKLLTMIDAIKYSAKQPLSQATLNSAAIGALIMAAPFYGLGFTLSMGLTQTNSIFCTKHCLSNMTGELTKKAFHNTGHHLTHFAANVVIDATVQRAGAKLFETLGILIGTATGGLFGLVVFDLSYQIFHSLCYLCKMLFPLLQTTYPDFAENADLQLIDCLLTLPPEVFSPVHKEQLRTIC